MSDVATVAAGFSYRLTRNDLEAGSPRETLRAHLRRYAEGHGLRIGARQVRHVVRAMERGLAEKDEGIG